MATTTPTLGLSKPDYADTADIAVINANMDKIDTAFSSVSTTQKVIAGGTYDGNNLVTVLGASSVTDCFSKLSARAKAKNTADINIGDYIDVTPTKNTVNRGSAMRYRIAGMGHNFQVGDAACPWAFWMVPDAPIDMTGSSYATNTSYIMWNTTANNNGTAENEYPYLASNLHKWGLEEFLPALPTALQNVLINHRILLEKRYSASGKLEDSAGWGWVDAGKVFSLNEMEVYGCPVWGTPGWSVGEAAQLPLFKDSRYRVLSRVSWWLRSVRSGSSSSACTVLSSGSANGTSATTTSVRPRPCFLIG